MGVITISRQQGSGGSETAVRVGDFLAIATSTSG